MALNEMPRLVNGPHAEESKRAGGENPPQPPTTSKQVNQKKTIE
jgi:hypothetical protein